MTLNDGRLEVLKVLPRIALVIDSENWAFHNYAKQISHHLSDSYDFQIFAASTYENPALLMLDVQNFDLIHFFWRADLFKLLNRWTQEYFVEKGWDYLHFVTEVIAKANITTSVYDHLFLSEDEIKEREILFNALSIGYTASSDKLNNIYSAITNYPKPDFIIEDGVDLELFTPINLSRLASIDRELVIGWVGNSKWGHGDGVDHKGLETIIKPAVESLKQEGYKIRGLYADRQEKWIPHSQMNDYYNSIDIYVCASDIEGKPDPALESMACGIPIISTDVGIIPQLFGPLQKEYILPARSVEALKSKLKDLIGNPQKRTALSQENLKNIEKWSWDVQVQKWNRFFRKTFQTLQENNAEERRNYLRKESLEKYLSLLSIKHLEKELEKVEYVLRESEIRIDEKDLRIEELETALKLEESRISEKDIYIEELQSALVELRKQKETI